MSPADDAPATTSLPSGCSAAALIGTSTKPVAIPSPSKLRSSEPSAARRTTVELSSSVMRTFPSDCGSTWPGAILNGSTSLPSPSKLGSSSPAVAANAAPADSARAVRPSATVAHPWRARILRFMVAPDEVEGGGRRGGPARAVRRPTPGPPGGCGDRVGPWLALDGHAQGLADAIAGGVARLGGY